jgi:serine phosphatase RsbU (regulator of sigma subunit)
MVVFGEPVADQPAGRPYRKLWGVMQDITEARIAQRSADQARAAWEAEHRVVELFQQAMLPADLPIVPRGELAATYLAAADRLDIGGDWYDALRLPDGRILLSVGDVAGHDQHAAATMGPVRAALRAYAIEDADPALALSRLNRFIAVNHPRGVLITAVVAVYDPRARSFTWANAGHPAPLLATESAGAAPTVAALADHGIALGVLPEAKYEAATVPVPAGAALCCYTDGLVERSTGDGAENQALLVRAVGRTYAAAVAGRLGAAGRAQRMVDLIIQDMLAVGAPDDDVCLVVLSTFG